MIDDLMDEPDCDEGPEEDMPEPRQDYPCSCPFCVCMVRTPDGGICDSCYQGAHQG